MMKPSFDDVVEYVKAGEADPEMSEVLDLDPDGQELLKQARFICKVLRDRYGESGDTGIAADADMAWGDMNVEASMRLESPEPEEPKFRTFYQSAPLLEHSDRAPPDIAKLLARKVSAHQELGVLRLVSDRKKISVSYEPSPFVEGFSRKSIRKFKFLRLGYLGIQIQALNIFISVADSISTGDSLEFRISSGMPYSPARHLDLVFMPDSGPFVRFESDDEGNAELPDPIQSGILRIETDESHFLRIKVEES